MTWVIFALSAAFIWAMINALDKVLVEGRVSDPIVYLVLHAVIGLFPAGVVLLIAGRALLLPDMSMAAMAFATGILEAVFTYFYYRALKVTDVSVVATVIQVVPVCTALIGLLLLGERYAPLTYLGILLVVLGTGAVAFEPGAKKLAGIPFALLLMIPGVISVSVAYSLESYTLRFISVPSLFVWARIGNFLAGMSLLLWPRARRTFFGQLSKPSFVLLAAILILELLNLAGVYLLNLAYAVGPLSLVTTLASVQPVFVLIAILLLNRIRPNTIPDRNTHRAALPRLLGILIVIAGILLLNMR